MRDLLMHQLLIGSYTDNTGHPIQFLDISKTCFFSKIMVYLYLTYNSNVKFHIFPVYGYHWTTFSGA